MKRTIAVLSVLTVTACGVDGPPETPQVNGAATLSNHGISAGSSVSVGRGSLRRELGGGL